MEPDFSRAILALGANAYRKISSLKVGVAGCGVIGQLLAYLLYRLGVRELRLLDKDSVRPENLPNSFLFSKRHVGLAKDEATLRALKRFSLKQVKIKTYHFDVTEQEHLVGLLSFVHSLDVVFGCFDNIPARLCLNSAAIIQNTKYIDTGIQQFDGRIRFIDRSRACYACNPLASEQELMNIYKLSEESDCDYAPTITILPVCLATVSHAILEGLKFAGIIGTEPSYDYIYFDFLTPSNPVKMKITKREDCIICGKDGVVSWSKH
jgi:molybdopterin/thiamine biosynthesis adenylyltransferase